MLPQSIKKWAIALGILVVLVIGSSIYLSNRLTTSVNKAPESSNQRIFPTEIIRQLANNFKILYQGANDTEGRTIIYTSTMLSNFNGSGLNTLPNENPSGLIYIVGLFDRWEALPNTADRLMYLRDPVSGVKYEPIYIAFQSFPLIPSSRKVTRISVENISKAQQRTLESDDTIDASFVSTVGQLSQGRLDSLIKPGDALSVALVKTTKNKKSETVRDDQGRMVGLQINLRRINGAKNLASQ